MDALSKHWKWESILPADAQGGSYAVAFVVFDRSGQVFAIVALHRILPLQLMAVEIPVEAQQQVVRGFNVGFSCITVGIAGHANIGLVIQAGYAGILEDQLKAVGEIVERHNFKT